MKQIYPLKEVNFTYLMLSGRVDRALVLTVVIWAATAVQG